MRNTALWCNGSTTGFGSVRVGSNPTRVTKILDKIKKCFVRGNRMFLCMQLNNYVVIEY